MSESRDLRAALRLAHRVASVCALALMSAVASTRPLKAQATDAPLLPTATAGAAPTAADLRAQRFEKERLATARKDSLDVIAKAIDAEFTELLTAGGRSVRIRPGSLTERERNAILEGLERANSRLRARFGENLGIFSDTLRWKAWFSTRWKIRTFDLNIGSAMYVGGAERELWRGPTAELIERVALTQAGRNFIDRVPSLQRLTGGDFSLSAGDGRYARAGRELALSWASAGRRCAAGSVAACRAVIATRPNARNLSLLFEPADFRAVVTSGQLPSDADSVLFASRRRCLAGSDSACVTIIAALEKIPDPFSGSLRATLVEHALELGGTSALSRLRERQSETDALALLVHVAGVSEDSLLRSWQARVSERLAADSYSPGRDALAAFGWTALVLVGARRRKP
jgi:hypothetical protein